MRANPLISDRISGGFFLGPRLPNPRSRGKRPFHGFAMLSFYNETKSRLAF